MTSRSDQIQIWSWEPSWVASDPAARANHRTRRQHSTAWRSRAGHRTQRGGKPPTKHIFRRLRSTRGTAQHSRTCAAQHTPLCHARHRGTPQDHNAPQHTKPPHPSCQWPRSTHTTTLPRPTGALPTPRGAPGPPSLPAHPHATHVMRGRTTQRSTAQCAHHGSTPTTKAQATPRCVPSPDGRRLFLSSFFLQTPTVRQAEPRRILRRSPTCLLLLSTQHSPAQHRTGPTQNRGQHGGSATGHPWSHRGASRAAHPSTVARRGRPVRRQLGASTAPYLCCTEPLNRGRTHSTSRHTAPPPHCPNINIPQGSHCSNSTRGAGSRRHGRPPRLITRFACMCAEGALAWLPLPPPRAEPPRLDSRMVSHKGGG